MRTYSIGIDIGTTSTKAIVFSDSGENIRQVSVEYPLLRPESNAAEQNPDEIFDAVVLATKKVILDAQLTKDQIRFISFSAAMHSLIALDKQDRPLTGSITWADQRSEYYARKLNEQNGPAIYQKTGTPIHSMSPLSKLIWMREEKPRTFKQADHFIGIKEYVFHKLFGKYVVDYSIASATGLFNIHTLDWDDEALKTAQITRDQLPKAVPTTTVFREMKPEIADVIGIHPDTPVVIGASDGCLANLGVNAIEPGVIAMTIGTSGAIRTVTNRPVTDPQGRFFCYALTENHWVIGGPVNNGGMIFDWMINELGKEETAEALQTGQNPFSLITEKIDTVPAGAEGLLFYPYLTGERAPLWNANAKGSFYGLALHHKKEHMMRAVLEGINLNLYMVYQTLESIIGSPDEIHASGGFAQSNVWRQMLADIFNTDIHVAHTVESSAFGATILGRYALDEINSLEEGSKDIESIDINQPKTKNVEIYKELVPIYSRISKLFEDGYDEITAFQQKYKK